VYYSLVDGSGWDTTKPTFTNVTPITTVYVKVTNPNLADRFGNGTVTITKKAITVTADNKSKVHLSANPALTFTYNGIVSGESVALININTTAVTGSPVGTYPITVTGPAFTDNYTITYTDGTLTVTKAGSNVTSITVNGLASIIIPNGDESKTLYSAVIYNQYGDTMPGTVVWSLAAPKDGVSINASTGQVTVTKFTTVGSVTVVATNGSIFGSKVVTLSPNAIVVTDVHLNRTTLTVYTNKPETLIATVSPTNASNKAVTWSSSNPAVATVDASGKVTGKAPGSAVITVTTVDGGYHDSATITVIRYVAVTSVNLLETSVTLRISRTYLLHATVYPTNATNKAVTWKSSNPLIASVDASGRVTARRTGTVTITVTTVDGARTHTCRIVVIR
jgi:hypothetical protein